MYVQIILKKRKKVRSSLETRASSDAQDTKEKDIVDESELVPPLTMIKNGTVPMRQVVKAMLLYAQFTLRTSEIR